MSLWIVNFQRADALRATLDSWMASFPFTDVNVIMNDPTMPDVPGARVWRNVFREPWETGSIAWCWNMCMRHTFERRNWCLMSQDDVAVIPGWDALLTDAYDHYIAPVGDTVMLQSLAGFNRVGWFDERFRAIGGPEADYELRAMRAYPDRLSVHDDHVWALHHNDVGLAYHWQGAPKVGEVATTRQTYNVPYAGAECFARWEQKWGIHVDSLFLDKLYHMDPQPGWGEIDWYPSFTRRLVELGRR